MSGESETEKRDELSASRKADSLDAQLSAFLAILSVVVPIPEAYKPLLTVFTCALILRAWFLLQCSKKENWRVFQKRHQRKLAVGLFILMIPLVVIFFPHKVVEAKKAPIVSISDTLQGGFAESGPFVRIPYRNFGPGSASNLEVAIVIADPAVTRNYYFTKNRSAEVLPDGSSNTLISQILTNAEKRWEPPWPPSMALIEFRWTAEGEGQIRTNAVFLKHQPTHPASKIFNSSPNLVNYAEATVEERDKYFNEFKKRMLDWEIQFDAERRVQNTNLH